MFKPFRGSRSLQRRRPEADLYDYSQRSSGKRHPLPLSGLLVRNKNPIHNNGPLRSPDLVENRHSESPSEIKMVNCEVHQPEG